jgi:hypothetical protein
MTAFELAGRVPGLAARGWKLNQANESEVYSLSWKSPPPSLEAPPLPASAQRVKSSPTQGKILFIVWLRNQSATHSTNAAFRIAPDSYCGKAQVDDAVRAGITLHKFRSNPVANSHLN